MNISLSIAQATIGRIRPPGPLRIADCGLRIAQSAIRDLQSAIERNIGARPLPAGRMAAALAALAAAAFGAEAIKVGEYTALTGKDVSMGQASHNGALLAVEHLNAAGGVLGRKLDLVTEDTQSKPGESATAVRKLISRDRVIGIIGEVVSNRSLEGASVCQAAKVPMITPGSTAEGVTAVGDYIFRGCFIDPFQGPVMARFARETLKVKRIALLVSTSSAYSVGLAKFFKESFTARGGVIAAEKGYSEGDKDFKAQLTALKATNVEAIFNPGNYAEGALIVRQARDLGLKLPIFGGDAWEAEELIGLGGKAVEGVYLCSHYSFEDPSPRVQTFVRDYKKRFKTDIAPDSNASLGYDSVLLLADGIRRAGSVDRAKIRNALATTKDFDAVTGRITINEKRDAAKTAVIITVKNGQFKYVETINP